MVGPMRSDRAEEHDDLPHFQLAHTPIDAPPTSPTLPYLLPQLDGLNGTDLAGSWGGSPCSSAEGRFALAYSAAEGR